MVLTVNGQTRDLPDSRTTVRDLVVQLGLADTAVAVEVNKNIVSHKLHTVTELRNGDMVEVVTLVGGG